MKLAYNLRGSRSVAPRTLPDIPVRAGTRVLICDSIAVPMTVAYLPGKIFVPPAWEGWSVRCRKMVLLHEMAHIRRRDGGLTLLLTMTRAFYFFHPLVILLCRRISRYGEMDCDDYAVAADGDSSMEYSRYLVEIAESAVRSPAVCLSASALIRRKNELLDRIRYQLKEGRMRSMSKTRLFSLAALVALSAVSLSWYAGGAPADVGYPDPPKMPAVPQEAGGGSTRDVKVLLRSVAAEVDGRSVGMEELGSVLTGIAGENSGDVVITLVCGDKVPMGRVRIFHEILAEAGIDRIRYVNAGGEGHPIRLPPEKALERLGELPADLIIDVTVPAGGGIIVGTRDVETEKLSDVVGERLEESPLAVVVIHNVKETRYGDFVKALGLIREAGAERIAIRFDK